MEFTIHCHTPEETFACGQQLASFLRGGDVICLTGDLGAGKTSFAQGVGVGLGVTADITSPTFTLIHEYVLKKPLRQTNRYVHMDLYRLRHVEEAEQIGVDEFFQDDTISIIEWPDIAAELLPQDLLEIHIEGCGVASRKLVFKAWNEDWDRRLCLLKEMAKTLS